MNSKPIAILGSGAWGQTLALLLQPDPVRLWGRHSERSLAKTVQGCELIISAVSILGVPPLVQQLQALDLPPSTVVVSATKGLDPVTSRTAAQLWQDGFSNHAIVVLSGPNLAKEIQQGLPAATVVASHDGSAATLVQQVFASERFRVYTSSDPMGVELGGTLKNVIAIAVGVCDGLQLGTNAKAALVTRGLAEMIRVGVALGAKAETFAGLSGLGDLLATCNSPLSRNYQVGYGLGQGKRLEEILVQLEGTAEGVNTAHVLVDLAHHHRIPVPITQQVHHLLKSEITPQMAVERLMERAARPEH